MVGAPRNFGGSGRKIPHHIHASTVYLDYCIHQKIIKWEWICGLIRNLIDIYC